MLSFNVDELTEEEAKLFCRLLESRLISTIHKPGPLETELIFELWDDLKLVRSRLGMKEDSKV